jgi:hypothetical protein
MKHVLYAKKSLLMDDATADALMHYAAALADVGGGDTVSLRAVRDDGNEVDVAILLNSATELIVESASAPLDVAANQEVVAYMRRRTQIIRNPPPALTLAPEDDADDFDELR